MSGNPVDPLQALSAALAVQADSKEQADLLATLRESLEAHPNPIPILCTTLLKVVPGVGDSLLRRWILDLLHFAIGRSSLSLDVRTQLASKSLDTLSGLLDDQSIDTVKVAIQCLTSVYPMLFRMLCSNRNQPATWDTLVQAKNHILELVWSPTSTLGVKLSAIKFMQRVIVVQTRGVSDPRLQNKNDPNISFCPADHPYISVAALEAEGKQLLEGIARIFYTSNNPDILSAVLNSWGPLTKLRPSMVQFVVTALKQWTPAALTGLPASSIKSVEKALRILLIYISRNASQYASLIVEALNIQAVRMDRAVVEEKQRKVAAIATGPDSKKRPPLQSDEQGSDAKRPKLDTDTSAANSASFLAAFDFTSLPSHLITELIVANIEAYSEPALIALVQAYRESRGAPPVASTSVPPSRTAASASDARSTPPISFKEEPVDPLQMVIDEEEIEYEPDKINLLSGVVAAGDEDRRLGGSDDLIGDDLQLIEFKLPPPSEMAYDDRISLMRNSVSRICDGAKDLPTIDMFNADSSAIGGLAPTEMWMLLIIRVVTRVTNPSSDGMDDGEQPEQDENGELEYYDRQDKLRQSLLEYIMADFSSRMRLATTWMNEEWYNDRIRRGIDRDWRPNYDIWLNQIVASYHALLDAKDRTFSRFLLDLPSVPPDVLDLLRDLCVDAEKMQVGFTTLREFVMQRPSLRAASLRILLELTTHPEKITRGAAIITVKRWVPDVQPMNSMIQQFALQMLRKLQSRPTNDGEPMDVRADGKDQDENMEDGQLPPEEVVQTQYLPDHIELPAQRSHVLQHVELLFALSVKVPELLDEIFTAYSQMDVSVQGAIQQLITALIKSLGSSHGKLLTLMRTFPRGAESLALRILNIFTEQGRPSAQLVALVKSLINEQDLDARFLIPIIAEMDKPDIMRHLPRIVSILNGQTEPKNLVRSVFGSIVTTPPQTFGSVTSNLPRVRQSELLTPAELMVLLHESEKEIGLKSAIEAIGICFSMTDVYRSEILAVVMQQIVDKPVLPVLFLRTVIQAVTTYKSLVGFVSTTLLSRLITKKIWTNPPLWEGFIRCAKAIAPASFGALLQLPKDQLRELVDKQPSLKSGLRDYVMKKAGSRARVAGFLDIFGEDDGAVNPGPPPQPDLSVPELPA